MNEIQQLPLPQHRLQQDVKTRWNSLLHTLKSILEQIMALAAYATGKDIPGLSSAQLDLAEKVIYILGPIDEITNSILANSVSVSVVIPFVEKQDNDVGVRTMKKKLLESLCTRYSNIEDNEYLVLATLLDPRG